MWAAIVALQAAGWTCWPTTNLSSVLVPIQVRAQVKHLTCILEINSEAKEFVAYILVPTHVTERMYQRAIEYVTRANVTLRLGAFEFDYDDGIIAFRSGVVIDELSAIPAVLPALLGHAASTVDRHFPGLMRVIASEVQPIDALEEVERYSIEQVVAYASRLLDD